MKRAVGIILSIMLVLAFSSGVVWAKPDHAKGGGSGNSKHSSRSSSASSDKKTGDERKFKVEVKDGKVEIKGNGINFESEKDKMEFKSNHGKVEVSEDKVEVKGNGLKEFQKKAKKFDELISQGAKVEQSFSDVNDHWGAGAIKKLAAIGLVSGYEDGTFQPDDPVTVEETIALLMRIAPDEELKEPVEGEEESTTDSQEETKDAVGTGDENGEEQDETGEELEEVSSWARGAVAKAAQKGIVNLNRFHSHVQAERAQVAVMVAKTMGLEPVASEELPFTDTYMLSAEDVGYIMALYNEGIIAGTPDGSFNPNSAITRAELAAIMERLLAQEEEAAGDETGEETTEEESTEEAEDTSDETE